MPASSLCCYASSRDCREFPKARIKLRADAGFALPLLYEFCELFCIQYVIGIAANPRLQEQAQPLQRRLARRYSRTGNPQRFFSSFLYRAYSWSHQRRICYKAEHSVPFGTASSTFMETCSSSLNREP